MTGAAPRSVTSKSRSPPGSLLKPNPLPISGVGDFVARSMKGGGSWTRKTSTTCPFFETMSKRRKGFASEKKVKCGVRIVHGDKELEEKVGRNDLCPCGSGKLFKKCCLESGCFRWRQQGPLLSGNDGMTCPTARRRTGQLLWTNGYSICRAVFSAIS